MRIGFWARAACGAWSFCAFVGLGGEASAQAFHYRQGGIPHGVFFFDANTGYVAEDGGRIRMTTDGGATWSVVNTPDAVRGQLTAIEVYDFSAPAGPDLGFCVGEHGVVLRTTNGGLDWSHVATIYEGASPTTPAILRAVQFKDASYGWVVGDDATIEISSDGGSTWGPPPSYPPTIFSVHTGKDVYDIHFTGSTTVSLALDYGTFAHTTDLGVTWTEDIHTSLCPSPTFSGNVEIWAIDFVGQNGVAAAGDGTNQGYFFRSTDGGATWNQEECIDFDCSGHPNCNVYPPTQYGITSLGSATAFAVGYGSSGFDRQVLSAPDGTSTCLSCPSGVRGWKQMPTPAGPTAPPYNAVDSVGGTLWAVGIFGVVRNSTNGGASWSETSNTVFHRIGGGAGTSASTSFLVGQGEVILRTTDGGATLSTVQAVLPGDRWLLAVDFDSTGANGVTVGQQGVVHYTTTGGGSGGWSSGTSGTSADLNGVDVTPTGLVYAVGAAGVVRGSTDGGATWVDADPNDDIPSSVTLNDVKFVNATTGIAVGSPRCAYLTINNGLDWTPLSFSGGSPGIALHGVDADATPRAFAVGDFGEVYVLIGGTLTLASLGGVATLEHLRDVTFVPGSNDVWVVGDAGTALRWDGSAWTAPKSFSSGQLVDATFFSSSSGFVYVRQTGMNEWQ